MRKSQISKTLPTTLQMDAYSDFLKENLEENPKNYLIMFG
jgi:hypothetical protein